MNVLDILTGPWAIIPEKLDEIHKIYFRHLKGEAPAENSFNNETKRYQVVGNTAIIPLHGVMGKRMNMFSNISGGVSTELIMKDLKSVLANSKIETIILDIDSPGGSVDGTSELAEFIFNIRGQKRIIAYSDGVIASAAYWVGAAADEVYISGDTVQVGSIGVVAKHVDYSRAEEKDGTKTTEVFSGKYKRIVSQYKPLSDEGRRTLQEMTDYIYSVFVDDVAKYRGVSSDTVLQNMADGRIFIGQQSITAGLVDGIATMDQLVGKQTKHKKEVSAMDLEKLKAEHPDIYQSIVGETREKVVAELTAQFEIERKQLQADIDTRQEEIEKLTATNQELGEENKALGKRMVVLEEKDIARDRKDAQILADNIFESALSESKIPAKHYGRVKRGVLFDNFYQDNKFDKEGYTNAVVAEIADWEKDIGTEVVGVGFIGKEIDDDDDALIDELVGMVEKK